MGRLFPQILVLVAAGLVVWAFMICGAQAQDDQEGDELGFKCSAKGTAASCRAAVGYVSPNATTLRAIQALFNVTHLNDLLGANGLPTSTNNNVTVAANQTVRIPFRCACNETSERGITVRPPIYKVQKDDTLYNIATKIFSGLVRFEQIQAASGIADANKILEGQEVRIPLPCSCDRVNGRRVLHYGHVVAYGSDIQGIAQEFGTTADTLMSLNGLDSPQELKGGQLLDVPLTACSSMVGNDSLDSNYLLVSNGTTVYTGNGCVRCSCDSADDWKLQCEPSQLQPYNSSNWSTCPSMQCSGTDNLFVGNSTTLSGSCNRTTCAYAGYNNQTIITTLETTSTCPASKGSRTTQRWGWNHLFIIAIHSFLFLYFSYLL